MSCYNYDITKCNPKRRLLEIEELVQDYEGNPKESRFFDFSDYLTEEQKEQINYKWKQLKLQGKESPKFQIFIFEQPSSKYYNDDEKEVDTH